MGDDEIKGKVIQLFKDAKRKKQPPNFSQQIKGDRNIQIGQVGGDITFNTPKTKQVKILPPPGSIGADPLLKQRIQRLFNKIGDERKKRYGDSAFGAMYGIFKHDFKIKNESWTTIWTWPQTSAPAIIAYLEAKYDNTIQGRIEKAASREGYLPARPYLYKMERELLEHLGLTPKSPEYRALMQKYFGVTTRTKLTHLDHWQLVCYLENLVEDQYK